MNRSTIAALDIGSSKVCCVIAHVNKDKKIKIVGYGYNASNGIKNGVITDINQATISVCSAVEDAEQKAKERISSLIVNISGDKTQSFIKHSSVQLHKNKPVTEIDIEKLITQSPSKLKLPDSELIHCVPMNYTIDKREVVKDPRNFYGETLGLDMLFGVYPSILYKNLSNIIENAHLDIALKTFSGYASALACLVEDEKELGATVVDIGGGTKGAFAGSVKNVRRYDTATHELTETLVRDGYKDSELNPVTNYGYKGAVFSGVADSPFWRAFNNSKCPGDDGWKRR